MRTTFRRLLPYLRKSRRNDKVDTGKADFNRDPLFVEALVKQLYTVYQTRVSFIGKEGEKKAKPDFCIPSKDQPNIIVEVKAYGATGSKQSDVIGDIEKIIKEKRNCSQI